MRPLSSGSFDNADILNFVAASRAQLRALRQVHFLRWRSLRIGSYEVSSQANGIPIFGAYAGFKCETGTTWLLKVTETAMPAAKDLTICVPDLDVPLLRGLQVRCTRRDEPQGTLWAQTGKLVGTHRTRAIAAMRLGWEQRRGKVAGKDATNKEIVAFLDAYRTQRRAYEDLCSWRKQSLKAGTFAVRSTKDRIVIFGAAVTIRCEAGVNWLLKATTTETPHIKDVALCVDELDAPLLRGLQLKCTREDDPSQHFWAQAPRKIGSKWTEAIETMRRGGTSEVA